MQRISDSPKHLRHIERIRRVDMALITLSAPLWLPTLIVIGLAVRLSSGRPILFVQKRVGTGGELFEMIKFRTMTNGPNPLIPDDRRITPIGRFLRRTSLDELPQILNVIAGEMSLVGPRPMLEQHARLLYSNQQLRFDTPPGLTGLAQVNGRNAISWEERIDLDVSWSQKPRLRRYGLILLKTIYTVLNGAGVDGHDPEDPFFARTTTTIDLTDGKRFDQGRDRAA